MRIAIVGSGVSGLVVAHRLHPRHEVTVFEAAEHVGGHVNTVSLTVAGTSREIDTGFIVYNETNYPLFTALLAELRVATQPTSMSFSVRSDRSGLEYNGSSLNQLFIQRRNLLRPAFHRMLRDILRFSRDAPRAVAAGIAGDTLGAWLAEARFGPELTRDYLVPMGSALWSIPPAKVLEMPAAFFVRFFENHGMLRVSDRPQWRVVQGGSRRYVEAMIAPFRDRIHLRTAVRMVRRAADHVLVDGRRFDHVVLACHSDDALALLADPTPLEQELLGALPYQANEVVLHSDESILPVRRAAWGSWNYRVPADQGAPAVVSYNMNMLQSLRAGQTFCVSLNAGDLIRPDRVYQRFGYRHPVYTTAGTAAQRRHAELGRERTHFCGAYWGYGFHEDGVRSGMAVVRELEGAG